MLDTVPAMLKPPQDNLVSTVRQLIMVLLVILQLLLWHWSRPTHQSSRVTSSRSSPMPRSWPRRWWIVDTLLCQVKNKVLWYLCSRSPYFFTGERPSATVLVKFDLPLYWRNGTLPLYLWNLHQCWWNWTLNSVLVKLCSTSVLGKLYSTYILMNLYSAWTLVKWHSTVKVAVACKRSRSFCQKCRWQVTVKHTAYVCGFDKVAWLYGVHRTCTETAAVSYGTSHATAVSTPLWWIFKNTL